MLNHWLIAFSFVIFRNVGPLPGPAPRPFKVMFTWARNLKDKMHLFCKNRSKNLKDALFFVTVGKFMERRDRRFTPPIRSKSNILLSYYFINHSQESTIDTQFYQGQNLSPKNPPSFQSTAAVRIRTTFENLVLRI